jgi:hypothetical protein
MFSDPVFPAADVTSEPMPLELAAAEFRWLVSGPHPVSIDGQHFPPLPCRPVPLDELRDLLLEESCPHVTRDAVWVHLIEQARADGAPWTMACVGIALPALVSIALEPAEPFTDDHRDIHSSVLCGFLAELPRIDLSRPWVMTRLWWAAYRGGHTFIRDALDAPMPTDEDFHSAEPAPPFGHTDFVLARVVAEGAITGEEAELIACTRTEETTLTAVAAARGVSYKALEQVRRRGEARLLAHLDGQACVDEPTDRQDRDVELRATAATTISAAAHATTATPDAPAEQSQVVTAEVGKSSKKLRVAC